METERSRQTGAMGRKYVELPEVPTYEINAYTDRPQDFVGLHSRLNGNILEILNEYGAPIMTPAYERDPAEPRAVPRENWFDAPARPPEQTDHD